MREVAGNDRKARLEAAVAAAEDEAGIPRGTMRVVVVGLDDGGGLSRVVARLARERGIADGEIVVVRSDPSAYDREFAEADRTAMAAGLRERLLREERDEGASVAGGDGRGDWRSRLDPVPRNARRGRRR